MSAQTVSVIDYRNVNAAEFTFAETIHPLKLWLEPSAFGSFQQSKFEIAEHHHTMHVIACGLPDLPEEPGWDGELASGERWLDGKLERERRRAGDIAIIPAGISHRCNWNTSVQFIVLAIEPVLLQQVGQDVVNGDRIELIPRFMNKADPLIQGICLTLREELECGKIGGALLIDSLKTTLAIQLLRNYCITQPKLSSYADGLSQSVLRQVREYIDEHLHQDLKLLELSAIAQISPYHFLRLFKQRMGITPHQYILRHRTEKAKHLLKHSELSIADIAVQTGFSDQSHLTRCFKRIFGITPKRLLQERSQ